MSKSVMQTVLSVGWVIAAAPVQGEEWTQFRGSDYGRTSETKVAERWVSEMVAWNTTLPGRGASSPVVFDNRIYLTAYTGYGIDRKEPGDPANLVRHLLCIEPEHGSVVWRKAVPAQSDKNEFNTWGVGLHGYASSTPAVDKTGIYIFFGETGVLAFSHAGEELWRTNCGVGTPAFGAGNSPVLYGNLIIANASVESGDMIALDKSDGSEAWRQSGINRAWNTPVIYRALNGNEELAVTIAGKVLAFDTVTGKPLWNCHGIEDYICPQITVQDGILYASGGRRSKMIAIRSGGSGDVTKSRRIWELAKGSNVSSPVYRDGHLYWAKEQTGILYCATQPRGSFSTRNVSIRRPTESMLHPCWPMVASTTRVARTGSMSSRRNRSLNCSLIQNWRAMTPYSTLHLYRSPADPYCCAATSISTV